MNGKIPKNNDFIAVCDWLYGDRDETVNWMINEWDNFVHKALKNRHELIGTHIKEFLNFHFKGRRRNVKLTPNQQRVTMMTPSPLQTRKTKTPFHL